MNDIKFHIDGNITQNNLNGNNSIDVKGTLEDKSISKLPLSRDDVKKVHLPKWVYWVWLISITALGLSITSIFWGYDIKWNIEIVSTAIILGFVGILATFVVVSNYMQVKDIKDDCERQINEIKDKFENESVNKSDMKIMGYKMEMYYSTMEGYVILYNQKGNGSYLHCSMKALEYYNKINEIEHWSFYFDGITLFIKHLSGKEINISESEQKAFLEIAKHYKGGDQQKLIEFIENLEVIK